MIVICEIAVWEYGRLFRLGGRRPAVFLIMLGVGGFFAANLFPDVVTPMMVLTVFLLLITAYHVVAYEKGEEQAVQDMAVSIMGLVYIGLLGSYFITTRLLPGGDWWVFTVLTSVWWADTGAYMIGSWIGKHRLAPRLSPQKSWEGYIAGIFFALLGSPFLLWVVKQLSLPVSDEITYRATMIIGGFMGVLPVLGDLTISMFKRSFGAKNTGKILLGHGGLLDRIDSWIWAMPIGYYFITVIILS